MKLNHRTMHSAHNFILYIQSGRLLYEVFLVAWSHLFCQMLIAPTPTKLRTPHVSHVKLMRPPPGPPPGHPVAGLPYPLSPRGLGGGSPAGCVGHHRAADECFECIINAWVSRLFSFDLWCSRSRRPPEGLRRPREDPWRALGDLPGATKPKNH